MNGDRTDERWDLVKSKTGFTLVEVIVVMAIMGILFAIATLSWQNMRNRYNVEKQAKDIYTDMIDMRLRAVQRDRCQFVSILSTTMYALYEDGAPPNDDGLFSAASDSLVRTYSLLPSYSLVLSNPSMTLTTFTTKGLLASSQTGTISIAPTAGGEYDCIVIDQVMTRLGKMNGAQCVPK